ncbi:uncharacterized protein LOC128923065 [Zeugodacus cucurbitae]|uniref:uncharacterized protein LOC128923065 n=1 Tax=Zeugodacus cucurbitae TaxID=28588 RepID=UPI0023D91949|nr:uncharacterized protein LOC128923065 [Zeugodacus cucurbitae]
MEDKKKEEERARILAQTSVGGVAVTTGGHSEISSCVASGRTSTAAGAGCSGCTVTAKPTLRRTGDAVHEDSDQEIAVSINTDKEDELLRSPELSTEGSNSGNKRGPRKKPSKEGLKAKARYTAAVGICNRHEGKPNLKEEEEKRLAWAREEVKNGRAHFATRNWCNASDPAFANRIEEHIAEKRQRSTEGETKAPTKRRRCKDEAEKLDVRHTDEKPTTSKAAAAVNEIARRHLIVALIDRSNPLGQMSQERWKTVEMKLLEALFARMDSDPSAPMPTFDGAGWLGGVNILKCKDEPSLTWVKEAVKTLPNLWENAKLEVVDRSSIPSVPKAKVIIPRVVDPNHALRLLQRQNPDVPTSDWRVLSVAKSSNEDGGQSYILQINNAADDILYARFGKMALVACSFASKSATPRTATRTRSKKVKWRRISASKRSWRLHWSYRRWKGHLPNNLMAQNQELRVL